MANALEQFIIYQKDAETRFLEWEERKMKLEYEEAAKRRKENIYREHELMLMTLLSGLGHQQHHSVTNQSRQAQTPVVTTDATSLSFTDFQSD